jgi:hypothetical protein
MRPIKPSGLGSTLRHLLSDPLTRDLDIDDPSTTEMRHLVIERKLFLRKVYECWYKSLTEHLPAVRGPILELGSGAGFMGNSIPDLITSEIFQCSGIKIVLDGCSLPLRSESLRAITMTNVLHHLPRCREFLREATRCLEMGGRILMVEPWVSSWSKWIYTKFHHEPFQSETAEWHVSGNGPLSAANGALPWILFERDRDKFEREFPRLKIQLIRPLMPFSYLVSGGVSLRSLSPHFTFRGWQALEKMMQPWMNHWAMFALIVIERT